MRSRALAAAWLQIPKLGHKVAASEEQIEADVAVVPLAARPSWPAALLQQIKVVRNLLAKTPAPAPADAIGAAFDGRNTPPPPPRQGTPRNLVATGNARSRETGTRERRYFALR